MSKWGLSCDSCENVQHKARAGRPNTAIDNSNIQQRCRIASAVNATDEAGSRNGLLPRTKTRKKIYIFVGRSVQTPRHRSRLRSSKN